MKKNRLHPFYTYGWLLLISICSCQQDPISINHPGTNAPVDVSFTLNLPIESNTLSRALSGADKNHLSEVDILVFNTTAQGGGFFMRAYGRNIADVNNENDSKRFTAQLPPGTYDLLILANSRKYIEEMISLHYTGGLPTTTTMTDIQPKLLFSVPDKWDSKPTSANYRSLPMWATRTNATVANNTDLTGIKMLRALAKIDVVVDTELVADFKLKSVSLYNRSTSGMIIPEANNFDSQQEKVIKVSLPAGYTPATIPVTYTQSDLDDQTTIDASLINTIYVPETPAGNANTPTTNPFLIIEASYLPHGQDYFYRIDYKTEVAGVKEYTELRRNHQYTITITGIRGGGSSTADEAITSPSGNIETQILECESGQLGKVVWNGEYYLSVAPDTYSLSWEAHTIAGTDNKLKIKTNYEKWSISPTSIVDEQDRQVTWLSIDSGEQEGGGDITANISLLTQSNTTTQPRTAYITVKGGPVACRVEVIQYPWHITDAQIIADDVIPAGGHTATFTLQGVFPETPVRVQDLANNQTVVEGKVPADNATAQVQLEIPLYWSSTITQPEDATLAFQYADPLSAQWITADTRLRKSYYLQTRSTFTDGYTIPGAGETFTTRFWGSYPDLYVRLWDGTATIGTEAKIDAATDPRSVSLMSGVNTGTSRIVNLQYSHDNQARWVTIASGTQAGGISHYKLSTGRYVASENVPFTVGQLWSSAMGISSLYDEVTFYTTYDPVDDRNNTNYTPTQATGCNTYSEPGYPQGIWRVPTQAELVEMLANIGHLSGFPDYAPMVSESSVTYWSSTEAGEWGAYSLMIYPGSTHTPVASGKDFNHYNLRCVRGEYPVTP